MHKLSLTKKYATHPEYKNSGVEWLNEIPSSWETKKIQRLFNKVKRTGHEDEELLSVYRDHGVIPKSSRDDNFNKESDDLSSYQLVEEGDLAINKMKAWQGSLAISSYRGIVSPAYFIYTPVSDFDSRFIHYLLRSDVYIEQYKSNSGGVRNNQWDLDHEQFRKMEALLPPKEEQEKIAKFLDEQTARIDETITKKQKLIELLKEKRTATISHAVTKGLDPHAELVDSGVKEIGLMPAHWEVKKLKHQLRFLDGRRVPLSTEERTKMQGEYPYYGASGIIDHVNEYIFDEDLILISEDGANLINRSTPISFIARGQYWVNNHAHIAKPKDENLEFWSERVEQVDVSIYTTGSAQPKLTIQALANIRVSAPADSNERMQIGTFVTQTREKYQKPLMDVGRSIQLLQEFKSSLISHAVTGKIKV